MCARDSISRTLTFEYIVIESVAYVRLLRSGAISLVIGEVAALHSVELYSLGSYKTRRLQRHDIFCFEFR
jgi:hypothetical protein